MLIHREILMKFLKDELSIYVTRWGISRLQDDSYVNIIYIRLFKFYNKTRNKTLLCYMYIEFSDK